MTLANRQQAIKTTRPPSRSARGRVADQARRGPARRSGRAGPERRHRDSSRTAVLTVAKAAFQGLAPLLVEFGITSPQVESLLRAVCVHETAKTQTTGGRRLNVSRVAVKTGVSRHVVRALLKNPPKVDGGLTTRRDSMRRVIDGWLRDPQYTRNGRPRDLDIGDPSSVGADAWTLIQRYAPGVWPRLIIDELIRVEYVSPQPNGRLRFDGRKQGKVVETPEVKEAGGQRMRDAMRAAFRDSSQSGGKRTWRTAQSVEVGRNDLPLVRKMLNDRLDAMIAWLIEELNSARWRRGRSKGGKARVGLSGFIFEELLPKDP
jgi:hypothetical protein